MNQPQLQEPIRAPITSGKPSSIVEILIVLAKYKRLVVGLPIAVAIVAAVISLVMPNIYMAGAKLLPPQQQQSSAAALLSQLGGMGGLAAGVGALKNPNDLYIAMLKSRTVADRLVKQFDLGKVYETDSPERSRRLLAENTIITSGKDGLITIQVEDESPKRAAQLASGYVTELLRLTRLLAVTEAGQRRVFFERELEAAKDNLSKAELALKSALDTRGVISVDADSRAVVETVARLRAQVSAKEIQLNAMRAFVTTTHPDYLKADQELKSSRIQLSRLENGSGKTDAAGVNTPVGLENIKVLREVKYYQMLYELLAKQYEVARLDEAKDPSIIQVLDPAVEPERKIKPKRAVIVLICGIFAFLAALFLAIILDSRRRSMLIPENAARWNELRRLLRTR